MNLNKIIKVIYFFMTAYIFVLIGTTSINFSDLFLSVLFLWLNYYLFNIGFSFNKTKKEAVDKTIRGYNWLSNRTKKTLFILALLSLIFSFISAYYYTGQTPIDVVNNLTNDISVYYEYQMHFREQNIATFSIVKIPFILMLFYIKILFLYSTLSLLSNNRKTTLFEKLYLFIVTFSHIYIGIARGTSFEFFELIIIYIYLLLRNYSRKKLSSKNLKTNIILSIVVFSGVMLYYSRVLDRGVIFNRNTIAPEIIYNPNGFISVLFPVIGDIGLILYNYFGFGFYYYARFISEFMFKTKDILVASLIPKGFTLINIESQLDTFIEFELLKGVRWDPDSVFFIRNIGILGLLLFCLFLGNLSSYLDKYKSPMVELTNYFILLQMISFPLGKFVRTSSANLLILLVIMIYWFWKIFINKKLTIK